MIAQGAERHRTTARQSRGPLATLPALTAVLLAVMLGACQAQREQGRRDAAREYTDRICRLAGDDPIIAAAVGAFVTEAVPRVGLFLYIPSTDSSPPPAGVQALQDKGTTFLYSTAPAQQAAVESRVHAIGDFPSLLVAYHGMVKSDPMHPAVKLSGRYVTGPTRGASTGIRAVMPQCDSTGAWQVPAPSGSAGAD